jgi:hypothetical protein
LPHGKIRYLVLDRRSSGANMAWVFIFSIKASPLGTSLGSVTEPDRMGWATKY